MNVRTFSEPWVEGFTKEAADMGLSQEETKALLKYASQLALMEDPNFAKGFQGEMQKQAGPWGQIGKGLMGLFRGGLRNPWKPALLGALGYYGFDKYISPWIGNKNPGFVQQIHSTNSEDEMMDLFSRHNENKLLDYDREIKRQRSFLKDLGGGGYDGYNSRGRFW